MKQPIDGVGSDRAPLAALRGFIRPRGAPLERCELCGKGLAPEHSHLVTLERRQIVCACEPCAFLFAGAASSTYKRVPRRITRLADFALSDEQWDALAIPIDLAFFLYSSPASQMVAVYPSPAGATESLLHLEAWDGIAAGHPRLRTLEPDVEALLVNRVRHREGTARHFVVPIDECYKLVGLIRKSWRGLSGGAVVWHEIAAFFAQLEARADQAGGEGPCPT
jgi:hypothetical protein